MKAIILVAGEGTRLRPYTLDRPKCMVEVDGASLIDRQIAVLKSQGIEDIVLVGGYKYEMLQGKGSRLKVNSRFYETNMVWTLFCAENEIEGDVIVSYGDIVYSKEILQELLKSKADIAVTIDKDWEAYWRARNDDPLDDAETLKLDAKGGIVEIGQKPKSLDEIEGQYMGLIKLSSKGSIQLKGAYKNLFDNIEFSYDKSVENAHMTDLLQFVINKKIPVQSVPIFAGWVEIDTVSDLESRVTSSRLRKMDNLIESN